MKSASEIQDEFVKELEMDTQMDSTTVMDKMLSSANIKQKWLIRKIRAQRRLYDLIAAKDGFVNDKLNNDNPLRLSKAVMAAKAGSDPTYRELQKEIQDQELLVEYLDGTVNKVLTQMSYEFRAIVDLMKLEQL